jgi:phosphatidylglycerol---prolipoprotein diacylglyceryl transferase
VGCFLTGLSDKTYGVATQLPWGVDFGYIAIAK